MIYLEHLNYSNKDVNFTSLWMFFLIKIQIDYILLFTGDEGLKAFNSWALTPAEAKHPKVIFDQLKSHISQMSTSGYRGFIYNNLHKKK